MNSIKHYSLKINFAEIDFEQVFTQIPIDISGIIPKSNVAKSDNLNSYKKNGDNYLHLLQEDEYRINVIDQQLKKNYSFFTNSIRPTYSTRKV